MSDLPYEITEQILSKLPARSLLRLTLVCKQWKSLISDPIFVKNHANFVSLDQSNHHSKVISNFITSNHDSSIHSLISRSIDYESLDSTTFELKFKCSIHPQILGSCNGLLLIGLYAYDFNSSYYPVLLLWNPLFSKVHRCLPPCQSDLSLFNWLHGCGHNPSIDDYTVVVVKHSMSLELQVQVYSMKTDSWKILPGGVPSTNIACDYLIDVGICVPGSIYWIIYDARNSVVIAFDLVTEKFKLIEMPWGNEFEHGRQPRPKLVYVRGYLGAYRFEENASETVVWIRNEDENKKGFWTKLLRIPTDIQNRVYQILSFMNNNEVLLHSLTPGSEHLAIYDSKSKMFRDIPCMYNARSLHMVETLVSPVSS